MHFNTLFSCLEVFIKKALNKNRYLLVIALLIPGVLHAQRVNLNHEYPIITAENQIWLGTPEGLFQYNPDDDSFKRFVITSENIDSNIKQLLYNDEILWCNTDSSFAGLHIRLNEWLVYDTSSGLPSNNMNGIALQEDYAWIATDKGAARFDLLIEEWEIYNQSSGVPEQKVIDIITINDNLWFVTDNHLSEYNPLFEKWRHYDIEKDSTFIIKRGFHFGEEIWLVGSNGMLRFNPEMQTQQMFFQPQFAIDNLFELFIEDNLLWAVTRAGIFSFDLETGVWKAFEGNNYLEDAFLITAFVDQSKIWVLLENGIRIWDFDEKNWEIIDYASGLSSSSYQSLFVDGETVFLINPNVIDYRLSENDIWRNYKIPKKSSSVDRVGKQTFKNLFDNDTGGYIDLGKYDWSWNGTRVTYIRELEKTINDSGSNEKSETTSGERLDIKNQITIDELRSISGYYNNIDYSETEYGVRYRSRGDDYLREFNWGDYSLEVGDNPFGEKVNLFGSNIWMRAGSKTDRFKRSRFNLKAITGEQQSRKTYEYYQGATDKADISIRDVDYLKNQFYIIQGVANLQEIEQVEIFVDDLNSSTNSSNTLTRHTIAGITGDFDLLKATEDYYIYGNHGMVRFTGRMNPDYTIVIKYSFRSVQSESVLQYANSINTTRQNVYYVGGPSIIPYSFKLEISDSSGNTVPISNFRIDDNGDGHVDSDRIDYQNGLLIFPDEHPFPPEVYDSLQSQSLYNLRSQFQTELSFIQLQRRNLVRGSEELKLDGANVTAGDDYVLDYTNGTLVFVREGVVSTDTRIEINYQYYLEDVSNQVHGTQFSWNPSDNLSIRSEWLQFTDGNDSLDNSPPENLLTMSGEIRQDLGGVDLRMIPGLAYNSEDNELTGVYWESFISSSKLRFQSKYNHYSENYNNLYNPQFILGDIKQQIQLTASFDIRDDTRISSGWNEYKGHTSSSGYKPSDQIGDISLLFHRTSLPVWQFSYHDFKTESSAGKSSKRYLQVDFEYQLPKSVSEQLPIHDAKLEASLRSGKQSGISNLGSDESRFGLGHVRLNTLLSKRFQGSFYYRRNDQIDADQKDRNEPMYRSEYLLVDFDHEEWKVLKTYLRLENKITQNFHAKSESKDVNLSKSYQLNLRFAPGAIYKIFSPTHFEFNVNQTYNTWGSIQRDIGSWIWHILEHEYELDGNTQDISNYYIKNELNLGSRLLLTSLAEWNNRNNELNGSSLEYRYWRWNEKINLKLSFNTRLNLQYRQSNQDWGYDRTNSYYEPSTWLEHRWTHDFQNTLYFLYRKRYEDDSNLRDNIDNWETRYDIVWRKNRVIIIRRFEIRQSFRWSHINIDGTNPKRTYQYNSNSSIDLYPLHSTILRFQFDLARNIDDLIPVNNYWSINFNLKLSLRF
ncbi:MAG: hypothetical protein GY855_16790 [candidate division Zixibacteria bacterium]|nr:hypothetical protein [candidate division Zixibacteria bacterium]